MKILGITVDVKVSSKETDGKFYVFQMNMPAGEEVPPHIHYNEDEIITVLSGELEIMKLNETSIFKKGDVANFPRRIPHGLKNASSEECQAIVVVSPGTSFENFFGELTILSDAPELDMNAVVALFDKYGLPLV